MGKSSCRTDGEQQKGIVPLMCLGCCPPSERVWFKWVLLAQPAIAVALMVLAHFGLIS